jgi:hypothetical protein
MLEQDNKKIDSKNEQNESTTKTKKIIHLFLWLLAISALGLAIASYVKYADQVHSVELPKGLQLKNGILHAKGFSDLVDSDQLRVSNLDYTHFDTEAGIVKTKTLKANEIESNTLKVSSLETNNFTLNGTPQPNSLLKSVDTTGKVAWQTNTSNDVLNESGATGDTVTDALNSLMPAPKKLYRWSENTPPFDLKYSSPNTPFTTYPVKKTDTSCYAGALMTIPLGLSITNYFGSNTAIMTWFYITPGFKAIDNVLWQFQATLDEKNYVGTYLTLYKDLKTFKITMPASDKEFMLDEPFAVNTWHHIACNAPFGDNDVNKKVNAALYVDGKLIGVFDPVRPPNENQSDDNRLIFALPSDSKMQDIRFFTNGGNFYKEIIFQEDVTEVYNSGLGTFAPSLSPYFVGHWKLDEGEGTEASNILGTSSILKVPKVVVQAFWDKLGYVKETPFNYLIAPQINFPSVLTEDDEIHTYFSVLLPVYLSGLDINVNIDTFKNVLSTPATNETKWQLGWTVIQDRTIVKDMNNITFTTPAVDTINKLHVTDITTITLPTFTKAAQLSGSLSRIVSNDNSPTVLAGLEFYQIV